MASLLSGVHPAGVVRLYGRPVARSAQTLQPLQKLAKKLSQAGQREDYASAMT